MVREDQQLLQAIVVHKNTIAKHKFMNLIALFNEDGTPYSPGGGEGGSSLPDTTDKGGQVLFVNAEGSGYELGPLPPLPPTWVKVDYSDSNEARPSGASVVIWIPTSPTLSDPTNSISGDIVLRSQLPEPMMFALSAETGALTAGVSKLTVRAPFGFTLIEVRASLAAASTSGAVSIDINQNGSSILSTPLTIDANERTSRQATTQAVISNSIILDDAELTFDLDSAGTGAAGLKVCLYVVRS